MVREGHFVCRLCRTVVKQITEEQKARVLDLMIKGSKQDVVLLFFEDHAIHGFGNLTSDEASTLIRLLEGGTGHLAPGGSQRQSSGAGTPQTTFEDQKPAVIDDIETRVCGIRSRWELGCSDEQMESDFVALLNITGELESKVKQLEIDIDAHCQDCGIYDEQPEVCADCCPLFRGQQ